MGERWAPTDEKIDNEWKKMLNMQENCWQQAVVRMWSALSWRDRVCMCQVGWEHFGNGCHKKPIYCASCWARLRLIEWEPSSFFLKCSKNLSWEDFYYLLTIIWGNPWDEGNFNIFLTTKLEPKKSKFNIFRSFDGTANIHWNFIKVYLTVFHPTDNPTYISKNSSFSSRNTLT